MKQKLLSLQRLTAVLMQRTDAAQRRYAEAVQRVNAATQELEQAEAQKRDGNLALQLRKSKTEADMLGKRHTQAGIALLNQFFLQMQLDAEHLSEVVETARAALVREIDGMDAVRRIWIAARLKQEKMKHGYEVLNDQSSNQKSR